LSVAAAEKRNPRVAEAVTRALDQAKTYKVEYEPDGSAKVKVSLELREVWHEIRSLP